MGGCTQFVQVVLKNVARSIMKCIKRCTKPPQIWLQINLQIGGCAQFAIAYCKKLHTVHKATRDVSGHTHSTWTLRTPNDGGDEELSPKVSLMPSGSKRTQSQRRCLARWADTATASHWNHPVHFFVTLAFVCCGLMTSDCKLLTNLLKYPF